VNILDEILAHKAEQAAALHRDVGESALCDRAALADPPRSFREALRTGNEPRVIAEFKRASPSRGPIRLDADPATVAAAYAAAGATALSVLTDKDFFQGSLADLCAARAACDLPVLRKDFVVDAIQVLEARVAGADAVLLIVAALEDSLLRDLLATASDTGLDALVEVHTREELDRALALGVQILGINNRDLRSFRTDVSVTRSLLPHAAGRTVVSESGIDSASTLRALQAEGVDAFLVGEALMRDPAPGEALAKLRGVG
jgi:indole-3-glycerol phosphate synthase